MHELKIFQRAERIEWTQASWSHYKLILEVCENDPNAKNEIMPQKLSQIAQSPSLQ